jgi:hypothetical protein
MLMLLVLVPELFKVIPISSKRVVEILPVQVVLVVIPPDGQSIAKLLKLTSRAAHIKKHWDRLKTFLIREFLINKF